jgi:putative phosphoesterase
MRLALISDIHGNLPALEAVVHDFSRRGVDAVVNLGDSLSGPLLPLETAQYLMAQNWLQLAGNHERQLLSAQTEAMGLSDRYARAQLRRTELQWITSLKPTAHYAADIFLCHGTPASDTEYFLDSLMDDRLRMATPVEIEQRRGSMDSALIACGHTHIPRLMRTAQGQLLVNPGSVGLPAYDDIHPHFHVVETGSPDARYAIVERINGVWQGMLLAVPYDYRPMAQLAAERGRAEWACALSSGYLK